jgi:hypothetical protein
VALSLAAFLVLSWPSKALAADPQEFELAKTRVDRGEYEEAAKRFALMLTVTLPPCGSSMDLSGACRLTDADLIDRARGQYAIALVALSREVEADAQIFAILENNPGFSPNPAVFPQAVLDRFTLVRGDHQLDLERITRERAEQERQARVAQQKAREADRRWLVDLERRAGEVRIVEKNSRWIALLPFGVGQLQNGDHALGAFFMATEVLAAGTAIVTEVVHDAKASANPALPDPATGRAIDTDRLTSELSTLRTINHVSFGVAAGLAVLGIVQAQIAFVPERVRVEKRPIPKRPSVTPSASIGPAGAGVSVVGTF